MNEITVNLGDEFDMKLWEALKSVLGELGGKICEKKWGIGGSQEMETFFVELEGSLIRIESETYIGVTVSGSLPLIQKVQRLVAERMNPRAT